MQGGGRRKWRFAEAGDHSGVRGASVLDGLAARRAAQANAELDPTIILEGRRAAAGQRIRVNDRC